MKLSNITERKFIDTIDLDGWEIETDEGFMPISQINKTIEYRKYVIMTANYFLECADTHIVFDNNMNEVYAKDLKHNDYIMTKTGPDKVLYIIETDDYENMYDIAVDSDDHRYFTNGILSHNSTSTICFLLWLVLFNENIDVALLANKGATARMLLARIQLAYYNLPKWLQQGIITWNKGNIELENGSSILAAATSSDSVRGSSFNCVFLDEVAFCDNFDEFYKSTYPTISSGQSTKFFMVSTPKGMNHFFDIWSNAVDGISEFVPIEVNWYDVPGRDEKWKEEQIKNTSEQAFAQEHGLEFLGSVRTLVAAHILKRMRKDILSPIQYSSNIRIYEQPQLYHNYILTCDCADTGADSSTISVIDITEYPFKQVATFKDDTISHLLFPQIIINLAIKYNNAEVLVESNDVGKVILHILNFDLEYDNVISTKFTGKLQLGLRTTTKTKSIGCARLADLIENHHLIIQDDATYQELMRFILKNEKTYQADDGYHDDMVMGLVIFACFVNSSTFKIVHDENYFETYKKDKEQELYESLAPLPLFSSGFIDGEENDNSWLLQ